MTTAAILGGNCVLPHGWRWVPLDTLFDVRQGVAMSPLRRQGISPHPFLRTLNILWGSVDLSNLDKMDFSDDEVASLQLREDDLLVCEGGDVGRTAIWRGELDGCLYQNHIHRLRRKDVSIIPNFYAQWLQAAFNVFKSYKGKESTTTIPNLSGGSLKSFLVPLPPTTAEQKRIVSILSEQMTSAENARLAAESRLQAASALSSAYLKSIFDGMAAQAWPKRCLGEICDIVAKQVDPKIPEFGQLPHVNGENIESGTCRITYIKTAKELGMTSGKYLFEPGDVLYSKLRPYLRKVALVDFRGLCSADMYPIRFNRDVMDPQFAAWMLISDDFTRYADAESRRARMPKLNRDQLFSYSAPVPSLDEQRDIASRLNKLFTASKQLNELLSTEFVTIIGLPAALLRQAFTGGI